MAFAGFSDLSPLPLSSGAAIYRARRDSDGRLVVLKTPRGRVTRAVLERWARERALLERAAGDGVIACLGLEQQSVPLLVLEDLGASSLDVRTGGRPLESIDAVRVTARVARALARIHAAQILHRDVNPSNVLVSDDLRAVWLIDFGIASPVSRERATGRLAEVIEGTLPYLAPEQSGRMNRTVDARSDLYSVGATLYELLTGRPPFTESDPLALVHAHIARRPVAPSELDSRIPRIVSDITMRLLEKAAEDRYQSALGLASDLERCEAALEAGEVLQPFELGRGDPRRRVHAPERLYGREEPLAALESAFERAAAGAVELVRLSGPAGIGKTALVLELRERITAQGGVLASGKCEQLDRGEPFAVLARAFRQRLRALLSERDDAVSQAAARVREALGDQLSLLVERIPELTQLVPGEHLAGPPLPPAEQEARLAIAARRLARCLATAAAPLVLFLDDLQWADGPTLRLVAMLATDPEGAHLLLVCAHRDVEPGHPLRVALDDTASRGAHVAALSLAPLGEGACASLLADALRSPVDAVRPLAELLHARSGGNPFFLGQVLETLEAEGHISVDPSTQRFVFDPEAIRRLPPGADVAGLLAERIERLEPRAQALLECAALSGASFDIRTLAEVMAIDPEEVARALERPVDAGLLDVVDAHALDTAAWRYAFVHDRVQQVAAERMLEPRRLALRLALGRRLVEPGKPPDAQGALLFEAVDHLDAASELVTDPAERESLARLNLVAGVRARDSGAYPAALAYLEKGRALRAGRHGARDELDSALAVDAAEAAYLATDFERMETLSAEVLAAGATLLERVRVHEVRINARIGKNDLDGALAEGIEVLALLGVPLPPRPGKGHVLVGLARTRLALAGWPDERIASLPLASRPEARAAMRIAMTLVSAAYYARPDLLPLLVFAMMRTTLASGISSESPYAFAVWGLVMASMGAVDAGHRSGELALRLRDRVDDPRARNRAEHIFYTHLHFWKRPWTEIRAGLRRTYETGYASGDLEYGAFSAMMGCCVGLYAGHELGALTQDMRSFGDAIRSLSMGTSLLTHEIHTQAALCLGSAGEEPWRMEGPVYDEREMLGVHERANDLTNVYSYRTAKVLLCLVFGRLDLAEPHLAWNRAHGDLAQSTVIPLMSLYVDVLVSLRRARSQRRVALAATLLRVDRQLGSLRRWAALCPANWAHRLELAVAERARVADRHGEAAVGLERAIAGARAAGALVDEALAAESAAEHQRSLGNATAAHAYLVVARDAYERWGAEAKVRLLEREFPELAAEWRRAEHPLARSASFQPANLDTRAVLDAAQAISKEIVLDRLVEALVRISLQVAGARRATLVMERESGLTVVAYGAADPDLAVRSVSVPLAEHPCPRSIVRYVQRARTDVVIDDAQSDATTRRDPYVVESGVRSILCVPVEQQNKVSAVLCLEHDRAAGAFTAERVALLRVLSSQAAIALENARLYDELRVLADAQSRFVPKQFLEILSRPSIVDVRLGDSVRKTMSILFSDIRGFTPLVESMHPDEHIGFINEYLRSMEPPILRHRGFVDSYIGDAIMALFDGTSGADEALAAGVGMADALAELNRVRNAAGQVPIRIGIGLHSGAVTLGTIGGPERIKCGVIGESVNLAARLEALTKTYDATLLASDALVEQLRDRARFTLRTVDRVRVRGSQIPITVREVVDAEPEPIRSAKLATLQVYERGVEAYYRRDAAEAVSLFSQCVARWPADTAATRYLTRAQRLTVEPAAADWTGVEQL